MKKVLIGLMVLSALATSCKKEKSTEPDLAGSGGDGSYQPMSKNSYWKYKITGFMNYESTITSTGAPRTIEGIPGTVFTSVASNTQGTAEGVYAIKGHKYYTFQQAVSPSSGATINLSILYLNDTASVGYTWRHVGGNANGMDAIFKCKILEKGITVTVEGRTYKDVIHSEIELVYDIPGMGEVSFMIYDYYVAKNIGVVQVLATGDPIYAQGAKTTTNLTDFHIK